MKKKKAILRADGNNRTGLGHIYRALAMIEILQEEFDCFFIIKEPGEATVKLISTYCPLKILPEAISVADEILEIKLHTDYNTVIVLDGYHFDSQYQKTVKAFAPALVAIDDKADIHFYADIVINHGDASVLGQYEKEAYCKVFTGFEYAVLRKEFIEAAGQPASINKTGTLLVCMGGADPFNITNKIIDVSLKCDFLKQIVVITGNAFVFQEQLFSTVEKARKEIVIKNNISASEMVNAIRVADMAICTASTVAMEICCVKTGLITGKVINNQDAIYNQLLKQGCALGIPDLIEAGESEILKTIEKLRDEATIKELIYNQAKALDGFSGQRIIAEIRKLAA